MTQLTLFPQLPLPLIVADKWGFDLATNKPLLQRANQ